MDITNTDISPYIFKMNKHGVFTMTMNVFARSFMMLFPEGGERLKYTLELTDLPLINQSQFVCAAVAYNNDISNEDILELLQHKEVVHRQVKSYHHTVVTRDHDGNLWVGMRGISPFDINSYYEIFSPHVKDMRDYDMRGKVLFPMVDFSCCQQLIDDSCSKVVFCGHSMGACQIIVSAAYVASACPDKEVAVYGYSPLVFYDQEFKEYVEALSNLTLDLKCFETDMVAKLFNTMFISDKYPLKNWNFDKKCLRYKDGLEFEHDEVSLEVPLSWILDPAKYSRHWLWFYADNRWRDMLKEEGEAGG